MFGNYSKLIGALVGNVVAIGLVYLATSFPGVAQCVEVGGVQSCTAFGFTDTQITMGAMLVFNSVFVYFFPPNKNVARALSIVFLALAVATLSACSLSLEQQTAVAKAYDKTCAAEPGIYQSFVLVATAKQASERTMKRAAAIHSSFVNENGTGLCQTRPTDLASASVHLAALYAQLITISAQVERQ